MTLHVMSHTHWDREWYMSFERHRYRLVKISIGPIYILQDEFLISAEANVRNVLYGLKLAKEYGNNVSKVSYFPDTLGNIAQMPQILKGFGIESAVVGRGDMHQSVWKGKFLTTVDKMMENYIFPQENGSHYDTNWAIVSNDNGMGFESAERFSFQATQYSIANLTAATHTTELRKDHITWVYLDYKMSGGDSNACGPELAQQYCFNDKQIDFKITIEPLFKEK
ncbi:hypothetical protein [Pseudogracilibacillus auburnensis]|uniref:glycoside hydrolase family 38 N-terminal domain-containing protein n=1 Tax=Pseudogracilibacillus auburnensis TaxID=1494959 RepID=UPI001A95B293|nr:hypothetical protein [Pseudogracilibacillus auburnensis]